MLLNVKSTATYELTDETFLCLMVEPLMVGPRHRVVDERLTTTPTVTCDLRHDLYGNLQRHLVAPMGRFTFEFNARIEVAPNLPFPHEDRGHCARRVPYEAMQYMLPSRYCQSDLLTRMAASEFGHLPAGGRQVRAIADWVWRHVEYRYGTTDGMTSAFDTATERIGVCRDFAHLVIAFCRALGTPARYVAGYALGLEPPDFHGYVQVYLGGEWHDIDATTATIRPALVPIAVGRDAADVATTTTWVPHTLIYQSVEVTESVEVIEDVGSLVACSV